MLIIDFVMYTLKAHLPKYYNTILFLMNIFWISYSLDTHTLMLNKCFQMTVLVLIQPYALKQSYLV